MTASTTETIATPLDRELAAAIDPWLEHMRWRPDFAKWREGRLWQENKQKRNLATLRRFMGRAGLGSELRGLKVLDLGCGMGGFTTALAREGAKVQPYDYNPAYCRITRLRGQRYNLDLHPVNGAGEALPFPNGYFDIIVCLDVLEHVQNPESLLAEVQRCLKPGGLCFITAINRFAFNDPHYHVKGVNWMPRKLVEPYLKLVGRAKDKGRFTDRQTLHEMHYFRYQDLAALVQRHNFSPPAELGELELAEKKYAGYKRLLQRAGLLRPVYKLYRRYYKGTYQIGISKL